MYFKIVKPSKCSIAKWKFHERNSWKCSPLPSLPQAKRICSRGVLWWWTMLNKKRSWLIKWRLMGLLVKVRLRWLWCLQICIMKSCNSTSRKLTENVIPLMILISFGKVAVLDIPSIRLPLECRFSWNNGKGLKNNPPLIFVKNC